MKKIIAITLAVFLIFSLAACTGGIPNTPQNESADENADVPSSEPEQKNEETPATDQENEKDDIKSQLPEKKMLIVPVEGTEEEREAILNESKYGYFIYILDGYTLNETDTGKSIVSMDYDPDFYAQVTILPKDLDKEAWMENTKKALNSIGEIYLMNPEEHFFEYYRNAKYFLLASSSKVSVMYMLHEVNGSLVEYKINMPSREAAEGAGPSLWTMLTTIEFK